MARIRLTVCVLGTALALLVPAVAQAQTVVINNESSTQSTSTATSPGQSATSTTSGEGSTEVGVAGGVDRLSVDSIGSSTTGAVAGPHGASATGSSVNESNIDLDCGPFGCGTHINCPGTVCKEKVHRGHHVPGHHHRPVHRIPFTIIPFPVVTEVTEVGRDLHTCEGDVEGLVAVGANCLSLLNDLSLNIEDLLDLGDVNLLSDLALDNVLNGLLGTTGEGAIGGLTGVLGGGLLDGVLGGLL